MNEQVIEFAHPVLNEPVSAIGGQYVFDRERRAELGGEEVLYYTGFFVMDRSCCGIGGSAYALVAGFVLKWKCRTADDGRPVSRVQPVTDAAWRSRITTEIKKDDPMIQVSFMPAAAS